MPRSEEILRASPLRGIRILFSRRTNAPPYKPAVTRQQIVDALVRLIRGEHSPDDQRLVGAGVAAGSVVVEQGRNVGIGGANTGVVVSGNHNRVVVTVDESAYACLQSNLFGTRYGVPPPSPPLLFLGRSRDVAHVKQLLGVRSESSESRVVIVDGWPGVGKSLLAAVVGRDPDSQSWFRDGVYWGALGQAPDPVGVLATWGAALGEPELLRAATAIEAASRLRDVFTSRRVLFLLDDIWAAKDASAFLQLVVPGSALLMTTRLESVALGFTTDPIVRYRLPVLDEEDALNLLSSLVPEVTSGSEEPLYRTLVNELGRLPLALHVAGRLLRQEVRLGWGVAELLNEVRTGAAILRASAPEDMGDKDTSATVSALLARSTDLLDPQTRYYFASLGFLAPKPTAFELADLVEIWEEPNPKPFVRTLVGYGLLEPLGDGHFQMHALLKAHARSLLEKMGRT